MPLSTISTFNWVNGIPRLRETLTAATNWPKFRKPSAAINRFVPGGSRDWSFVASFVLFASFCWTGVSVTVPGGGGVVPLAVAVVVFDVVVVLDVVTFVVREPPAAALAGFVGFACFGPVAGFTAAAGFIGFTAGPGFTGFAAAGGFGAPPCPR